MLRLATKNDLPLSTFPQSRWIPQWGSTARLRKISADIGNLAVSISKYGITTADELMLESLVDEYCKERDKK